MLTLFIGLSAYGQEYGDLSTIKFWTYGNDTGYAIIRHDDGSQKRVVDRIRRNDTIFEFYIDGLLRGKGKARLVDSTSATQPDGTIRLGKTYAYYGEWIIYFKDSIRKVARTGQYYNHEKTGRWLTFDIQGRTTEINTYGQDQRIIEKYDSMGKLTDKTEYAFSRSGKSKIVEDITYINRTAVFKIHHSKLERFIHKNTEIISALLMFSFFVRLPLNHLIYNSEYNTDYPLFWFPGHKDASESMLHGMLCLLTFWWFKYQPKNRVLVVISVAFSMIFLLICALMTIASL